MTDGETGITTAGTGAGTFPVSGHDHTRCLAGLMAHVDRLCAETGVRLTAQRRRVLEIVAGSHAAVGAYDILARMNETGRPVAPIAVYRALDFLLRNGLVHRMESLNAYVVCNRAGERHRAQFLICRRCHCVAELTSPSIDIAIAAGAEAAAFEVTEPVIEIGGLCPGCRPGPGG